MIIPVLRKDVRLLWPMALLVVLIQAGLEWADLNFSLVNASPAALELFRPLTIAWFLGIAALAVGVVQQDSIPGVDQDWLIRPLRRRDLLFAKMLFMAMAVSVPMFLLNLLHTRLSGFAPGTAFVPVLYKTLYTYAFLILPLMSLAAITRTTPEIAVLGAVLIVVYAASSAFDALLFGTGRCPVCDTGLLWQQHFLQHTELALGAVLILILQYERRCTRTSRLLAVLGTAAVVVLQLPWNMAFALQQRLPAAAALGATAPVPVGIEAAGLIDIDQAALVERARPAAGRLATRALLHGDVDGAVQYLQRIDRREPIPLRAPLHVVGLAGDEVLLADRTDAALLDAAGHELYRARIRDQSPSFLSPLDSAAGGATGVDQLLTVPHDVFRAGDSQRLRFDYALTLMKVSEQHEFAALDGVMQSDSVGICRSRLDEDSITVRCRQVGRAPFCYSATLSRPDGTRNPEVRRCTPDYRPYVPSFAFVLSYYGLEMPVRDRTGLARYPVGIDQLRDATVVFKVYMIREHFHRSVQSAVHAQPRAEPR